MSEKNKEKTDNKERKTSVLLRTYGCQMNEYDSELVQSILESDGYSFVNSEIEADIILLNTCSVRENAHRKVFGHIHEIRHKLQGKKAKIGILGCMATALKSDLLEDKGLKIDFICGPDNYKILPELIRQSLSDNEKHGEFSLTEMETYKDIYPTRKGGVNAWIAVMRGCNNFCTFCIVPYVRGRERSRSVKNILDEINNLTKEGVKQVTLLGQNVNSYNDDGKDFSDLLNEISKIDEIFRIRFTSPHPKDFPDKLIDTIANNKKVCKHIHLPLQAGNTRVLDMMNRTYSKENFLNLVDKIKSKIPQIAITTDIIVGFPTETDIEFEDTVDVINKVQFDSAFIFKYSPRKGTVADRKFKDDVPEKTKTERIVKLNELQKEISYNKNLTQVNKTLDILVEDINMNKSRFNAQGRSDDNKLVLFNSQTAKVGDFIPLKISAASPHLLKSS